MSYIYQFCFIYVYDFVTVHVIFLITYICYAFKHYSKTKQDRRKHEISDVIEQNCLDI